MMAHIANSLSFEEIKKLEFPFFEDERGGFGRIFCDEMLLDSGIVFNTSQVNLAYTKKKRNSTRYAFSD